MERDDLSSVSSVSIKVASSKEKRLNTPRTWSNFKAQNTGILRDDTISSSSMASRRQSISSSVIDEVEIKLVNQNMSRGSSRPTTALLSRHESASLKKIEKPMSQVNNYVKAVVPSINISNLQSKFESQNVTNLTDIGVLTTTASRSFRKYICTSASEEQRVLSSRIRTGGFYSKYWNEKL